MYAAVTIIIGIPKHTYAAPGGRGWLFAEPYYYCTRPTAVHF